MTLSGLEIGELCFLHLFKLRELLGTCHVPFACYAELVDTADQRLSANCSPNPHNLKFSQRSQLPAMALSFAQVILFCSYLFKMYPSFSVTQLELLQLLIFLTFLWNLFPADAFCRLFIEDAKMHYFAELLTKLRK